MGGKGRWLLHQHFLSVHDVDAALQAVQAGGGGAYLHAREGVHVEGLAFLGHDALDACGAFAINVKGEGVHAGRRAAHGEVGTRAA